MFFWPLRAIFLRRGGATHLIHGSQVAERVGPDESERLGVGGILRRGLRVSLRRHGRCMVRMHEDRLTRLPVAAKNLARLDLVRRGYGRHGARLFRGQEVRYRIRWNNRRRGAERRSSAQKHSVSNRSTRDHTQCSASSYKRDRDRKTPTRVTATVRMRGSSMEWGEPYRVATR